MIHTGAKSASSLSSSHCGSHTGATFVLFLVGCLRVVAFDTVQPEDSGVVEEVVDSGVGMTPGESRIPGDNHSVFLGALNTKVGGVGGHEIERRRATDALVILSPRDDGLK